MKPNPVKTTMIRAALKKGLADIRENPGRGMRNLLELGTMFAGGHFQKDFFDNVLARLQDENSAYYQLIEQVIQRTDSRTLCEYGINMGYNALAHGANIIRETEAREGFNIPWNLTIDVGYNKTLHPADIESIVRQGRELGIYSYLLYIDEHYAELGGLLDALARLADCAFTLFVHPHAVTDAFCKRVVAAGHMAPMMDLDHPDAQDKQDAAARLLAHGCLCGGFARQPNLAEEDVAPALLHEAALLQLPFFVSARLKRHLPYRADSVYNRFVALRENLPVPVLPLDLYGDIAHVDRVISGEACLAAVLGDGTFAFTNVDADEVPSRSNIFTTPLFDALRTHMPKAKAGPHPAPA